MIKRTSTLLAPFLWAMKLAYKASPRLFIVTSGVNTIISSVSGVINAFLIAKTTASVAELAAGDVTIRTPIYWAVAYGAVTIFFDIVRRINGYYESVHSMNLELLINSMYANKVSSFTQEQLDDSELQVKLSMSRRELSSVQRASELLQDVASAFIAYMLAVAVLWQYSWGIAVMLMLLIPLLVVNNHLQTKRLRTSWEESTMYWRISSGLYNYITDPLRLFQIKIMGAREKVVQLYAKSIKKRNKIELAAERKNILLSLINDIISPLIDVGTRIWAIVLIAAGKLTFDQFLFVIGMIQQASSQTFALGYTVAAVQEAYISSNALKNVVDYPLPPDGTKNIVLKDNNKGIAIDCKNVSLTYPDGTVAIDGVTMRIPAGAKVALVGENGAGKSSLLRLIMRQYEPTGGQILLNGMPSTDVKRESLYANITVLAQDYYLFHDLTIRQNLTIATKDALSEAQIDELLDVVQMQGKISKLEHGLDTRLDKSYDDGTDLSGGQMQRLAIARAMAKKYKLMILDEPTSAIDAKAERTIFNRLLSSDNQSTMVIVSHRFSTVRKADYIYVIDGGHVIEQGTHDELMALKGHYFDLYTIQAEDFA